MDDLRVGWICIALVGLLMNASTLFAQRAPSTAPATRPTLKSPEIAADGRVTFRLWAPQAQSVSVLYIGPGGNSYNSRTAMTADARGVWSATTEPLPPEIYAYSFSVDGMTMIDPSNPKLQTGFAGHQSQLRVPGRELWDRVPGVEHGVVAQHLYHSDVADDDRDFWVYTPPGYDPNRGEAYPVLYLLHGLGDRADSWIENGAANLILDNLIAQKKIPPMVMVNTLGYGTASGPMRGRTAENVEGFSRALLEEVLPRVEKEYHVARDPDHRAIAGLSMGGAEATWVGLKHPEVFSYVGTFSGAYGLWPDVVRQYPATRPVMDEAMFERAFPQLDAGKLKLLWIACGTADGLIDMNRSFHDWLTRRGISSTYTEAPGLGHVWPLWRHNLAAFAQELFKRS